MSEESVIEPETQCDSHQRQRDRQERKNSVLARSEFPRIQRHKQETKRTADDASDPKDQGVFDGLFYGAVDRSVLLLRESLPAGFVTRQRETDRYKQERADADAGGGLQRVGEKDECYH